MHSITFYSRVCSRPAEPFLGSSPARLKRLEVWFCRGSIFFRGCGRRSENSAAAMASLTAADMGVVAAKAAMERAGVEPAQVDETIIGCARQAGGGPNVARQISVRSGVPQEVPAFTVNKACASGMKSIALAYQSILRRRRELHSGGRHRVDVARSLLSRRRALGIPAGQSGNGRRHVSRRILLSAGEDGDGRDRRSAGRAVQDHARGAGRICAAVADARRAGDCGRTVRCGDRSRDDRREEGRDHVCAR